MKSQHSLHFCWISVLLSYIPPLWLISIRKLASTVIHHKFSTFYHDLYYDGTLPPFSVTPFLIFNTNWINPFCLSYIPSPTFYFWPPYINPHYLFPISFPYYLLSSMTYHFLLRAINQETLNHLLSFAITSFSSIHLVIDYTENYMRILRVYSASNKTALSVKVALKYVLLVTLYVFPLCTIVYWRNFLQMSLGFCSPWGKFDGWVWEYKHSKSTYFMQWLLISIVVRLPR